MIKLETKMIDVEYDEMRDVLTIEGLRYAGGLFRAWILFREGTNVQIVKHLDGVLSLKSLHGDA